MSTAQDIPSTDALAEFTKAVWRIAAFTSDDLGGTGTCGYLLSEVQVGEIASEAAEMAKGAAEGAVAAWLSDLATRERLVDILTRVHLTIKTSGPAAGMVNAESFADAIIGALREETQ